MSATCHLLDRPSPPSNELFEKQWHFYQKVFKHNYMGHHKLYDVYDVLQGFLADRFEKPFRFLDFGCGDATFAVRALANTLANTLVLPIGMGLATLQTFVEAALTRCNLYAYLTKVIKFDRLTFLIKNSN